MKNPTSHEEVDDLRKLARGMYTVRITHKFENKELVAQIIIQ